MTKKDYICISDILNQYAICERDNIPFSMDDVITSFSLYLEDENPHFNKERFYEACYSTK